uniref:Uncharacterized protein n=1 Tax=Panagrolaimus superbus TaxID=310955 RepID=A0A914YEG7_9BILA
MALLFLAYTIPLPFGGIDVNKRPDGSDEVSVHNGINVSGYGYGSGLTFNGKNGTGGSVSSHSGVLDGHGGQYGIGSTFGGDKKKGVQLDSDLNLGNETVHVSYFWMFDQWISQQFHHTFDYH